MLNGFIQTCVIIIKQKLNQFQGMLVEQSIKRLVSQANSTLVQSLRSLEQQHKKSSAEDTCTKLKIIIGLISENNSQELQKELADFNDPDLVDIVKSTCNKFGSNIGIIEQAPAPAPQPQRKKSPARPKQGQSKRDVQSNRSNSLIKDILGKFVKIDTKKPIQVKLPSKQQKCYFDPVKNKYIFEGEQQEQVKEIPKPPPARKGNNASKQSNKPKQKVSELQQMMAPPAFVRRGAKKKQQISIPKQQPMTFDRFIQKMNNQLEEFCHKAVSVFQQQIQQRVRKVESSKPAFPVETLNLLGMVKNFSEQIRSAQQISDTMMTRLYSSYIDSDFDGQVLESMLQQLISFQKTNLKVLEVLSQQKTKKIDNQTEQKPNEQIKSQKVIEQSMKLQQQIQILKLERQKLKQSLQFANKLLLDQKEKYRLNLDAEVSENKMIKLVIEEKKDEIIRLENQKQQKQNDLSQLKQEIGARKEENKNLKNQVRLLKQKLANFESNLYMEQQQILQILQQKSTQVDLMDQLSQTLFAENDLFLSIQSKRISICTQGKQPIGSNQVQQPKSSLLFDLSDSFSRVIQHYEGQLAATRKQCAQIQQNFQSIKADSGRTQQSLSAENQSLQRSVNRLKSLMEDYKQEKQELQIKIAQLQSQNQGLSRQITHLRKQHSYTKQVLQQNIRASHDNTATMKQQLQSQIKCLEQQLEQKQINQRVLDKQIKETTQQIQTLVGESKAKSIKITNLQKQIKSLQSEMDQTIQVCSQWESRVGELERQIEYINSKTSEQKSKNENQIKSWKSKIKEANQQCSMLKQKLKQSNNEKQELRSQVQATKKENEEIMAILEESNSNNEQIKVEYENLKKQNYQFQLRVKNHQGQVLELMEMLEAEKQDVAKLKNQAIQYRDLYSQQTTDLQLLLQQLYQAKQSIDAVQKQYLSKAQKMHQYILDNEAQTKGLCQTLSNYEQLTSQISRQVGQISSKKQQQNKKKETLQSKIRDYEQQIGELKQLLESTQNAGIDSQKLSQRCKNLTEENRVLQSKIRQLNVENSRLASELETVTEQKNSFEQITFEMQKELDEATQKQNDLVIGFENGQLQLKGLKNKLSETMSSNQILSLQCSRKQKQIQILTSKMAQIERQSRSLRNNKNTTTQQANKIAVLLNENERQMSKKNEQLKDLTNQIDKLSVDLTAKKTKIDSLQSQLRDVKVQNEEYNQLLTDLNQRLQQNEKLIAEKDRQSIQKQKGFEDTINDLLLKLDARESDQQAQIRKISELESQINQLTNQLKEKSQKNQIEESKKVDIPEKQLLVVQNTGNYNGKQKLISNIQSFKEQMSKQSLQIDRLTGLLDEKQLQIAQLLKQTDENNKSIQDLLLQLEEKQKLIGSLTAQVSQLEKQLRTSMQPKPTSQIKSQQSFSKQYQELEQLILAQNININEQVAEIQNLKQNNANLVQELATTKERLESMTKDKNQLNVLYHDKSEQADSIIQKLEAKLRDSSKFQVQITALQAKIKDLQSQVKQLIQQKSDLLKINNQIVAKMSQKSEMSQIKTDRLQERQKQNSQHVSSKRQESGAIQKKQEADAVQKPAGFFGSLSSLFLTPTEVEKLGKTRK